MDIVTQHFKRSVVLMRKDLVQKFRSDDMALLAANGHLRLFQSAGFYDAAFYIAVRDDRKLNDKLQALAQKLREHVVELPAINMGKLLWQAAFAQLRLRHPALVLQSRLPDSLMRIDICTRTL